MGTFDERRLARRTAAVLNWHIRSQSNDELCRECGQEYPCRTRLMLLGREDEAAAKMPVRWVFLRKT